MENEVTGKWLAWELDAEVDAPILMLPGYEGLRGLPAVEDVYTCRRQLCIAIDEIERGEA